jgi:hypothetical protein
MEEKPRTATEVLLQIENKLKSLEALMNSQDFNIKNIYNQMMSKFDSIEKLLKSAPPPAAPKPIRKGGSVQPVDEAISPIKHDASSGPKKIVDKKVEKTGGLGYVNVTQVIKFSDGKRLIYAQVRILNQTKQLVADIKTNTTGRWMKELLPGEYTVQVQKIKPEVNIEYPISIQSAEGTVELPSPDITAK